MAPPGSYPNDKGYLDNLDETDPLNRLALGAADGIGAEDHGVPQTAYDGYVKGLQDDLWALGVRANLAWGVYDRWTEELVVRFQLAAARAERGGAAGPVEVTYTEPASGVADAATRREIRRWQQNGWYVAEKQICDTIMRRILWFTARRETGCTTIASRAIEETNVRTGRETTRWERGALDFRDVHPREGLRVGILAYSQRSGWLGKLLHKTFLVDPDYLSGTLGDFRDVYNATRLRSEEARMATRLADDDRWRDFVIHPGVQDIQVYLAREQLLEPVLEAATRNRIRTIRGLAFLFDVAYKLGTDVAAFAADACGYRDVRIPVREHLQPGLVTVERLLSPGQGHLAPRFRELMRDPDLDETEEYFWNIRLRLIEKNPETTAG